MSFLKRAAASNRGNMVFAMNYNKNTNFEIRDNFILIKTCFEF